MRECLTADALRVRRKQRMRLTVLRTHRTFTCPVI
jgi:hypothetical protein